VGNDTSEVCATSVLKVKGIISRYCWSRILSSGINLVCCFDIEGAVTWYMKYTYVMSCYFHKWKVPYAVLPD
jgi:hypothetical protein